jgi:hypothetical protein
LGDRVGLIHAAALALVLPMLITLPAPGSLEHKAETVDVELIPAIPSAPKIDEEVDQTAALPASPQPEPGVGEAPGQPEDAAPDAVANVDPESVPPATPVEQAEPASETPAPAIAAPKKSKMEGKVKRAKAAPRAPKKPQAGQAVVPPDRQGLGQGARSVQRVVEPAVGRPHSLASQEIV